MSLRVTRNRQCTTYFDGGNFVPDGGDTPIYLQHRGVSINGWALLYLDRLQLAQSRYTQFTGPAGQHVCRWDPLLLDNTSTGIGPFANLDLGNYDDYIVGDYEPVTGSQRLFRTHFDPTTPREIREVLYADPEQDINSDVFSNFGSTGPRGSGPASSAVEGWWDISDGDAQMILWPEWGKALILGVDETRVGGVLRNAGKVMTLVDLATGEAETYYHAAVDGEFYSEWITNPPSSGQTGELYGEPLTQFTQGQFLPDPDSLHLAPKGRLLIWDDCSNGSNTRIYFMVIDWNPFGVQGTPNRVHLRQRLLSRAVITPNSNPPSYPDPPNNEVNGPAGRTLFFYEPQARRISTVYHPAYSPVPSVRTPGDMNLIQWSEIPEVNVVTKPAVVGGQVTTNKVALFQSEVLGDLGEVIVGADANFTLTRAATYGELLTQPTVGTPTVSVDNPPIDREVDFAFAVYLDGTPLTPGVDYTDPANGDSSITFLTFVVGIYTVDYAHTGNTVAPAVGTLLNTTAQSDGNGRVFCRAQYADDASLEALIDRLDIQVTD